MAAAGFAAAPAQGHAGHRGTRAVQRLVEYAPSTGALALWMHHVDLAPTHPAADGVAGAAPPVATDGHRLLYSPAFATLPLPEQAGWVAHEVLHIALRHAQRFLALQSLVGDVDLPLFNLCADAIVNSTLSHLAWLALPKDAVQLDTLLASTLAIDQPLERALLEWDVERLYREIDDRRPARGGGRAEDRSGAQGDGSNGTRQPRREDGPRAARARALAARTPPDLQPDSGTRDAPEAEAGQAREWCERLLRAHAGDGAFSMLRTLGADLPRTRTPWQQVLRTQLARALTPRPAVAWSRPARSYIANQGRNAAGHRMPWEPGVGMARRVPRLAVVVDVSGSIDDALMERFAREIDALTRRLEAGLVLVIGDDRVRELRHCQPGQSGLRELAFTGGGGTDFTPLLQAADTHHPDIGVVLTDLDGPARFKPRWPVVWAVPEADAHAVAPFGRVLVLR